MISAFSPSGLQLAWDSTSLTPMKICPRKYQLSILEGWRAKSEALPLSFGIALHKCYETFYRVEAETGDQRVALRAAVKEALCFLGTWTPAGFTPWKPDDTTRTRENLVRTVIWYSLHYAQDPVRTAKLADGRAAVEVSFRYEAGIESPEGPYLLCGHLDRLVDFDGLLWVEDYKHTVQTLSSNYFRRFTPDNQMSNYAVAGQIVSSRPTAGVIVSGQQIAVSFSRFMRGFAARTRGQLEEWLRDARSWIKTAEFWHRERGNDPWPMNDTSCHQYGGCPFLGVCDKDPEVRGHFLSRDFERKPWEPLATR